MFWLFSNVCAKSKWQPGGTSVPGIWLRHFNNEKGSGSWIDLPNVHLASKERIGESVCAWDYTKAHLFHHLLSETDGSFIEKY